MAVLPYLLDLEALFLLAVSALLLGDDRCVRHLDVGHVVRCFVVFAWRERGVRTKIDGWMDGWWFSGLGDRDLCQLVALGSQSNLGRMAKVT